ncbi:MAG: hypothetical protein L3J35_06650 [Bacteroidales bacterium]|nr:hypothetical protein [Bacteroidales bacterium]
MQAYKNLIQKLDIFIKKYYKIRLIRGLILAFTILLSFYLLISLSEFFIHFSVLGRTIIFFLLISVLSAISVWFIIIPALKLLKIGKIISYKEASNIIKKHFPEIKDKLLNVLELHEQNKESALVTAAINQKAEKIKVFPFKKAVQHKENIKYLKYAVPVLLIFIAILTISPSVFKESTKRIVNYKQEYIEPAPFSFILLNDTLNTKRGNDFTVKLKIKGEYIPDEVFINYAGNNFLMKTEKNKKTEHFYEFKNLNNSLDFYFSAQDIKSENYKIQVLPSPTVLNFFVDINYPAYTGEKDTTYNNIGDIVVPYGSKLKWKFTTKNVDSLYLFSEKNRIKTKKSNTFFEYNKTIYNNFKYSVSVANKYFINRNLINFNISVIPDLYPSVAVQELKDTANFFLSYFKGIINDDYGIKKLEFKFRIVPKETEEGDKSHKYETNYLQINNNELKQEFYYTFDFNSLNANENQIIQYYFQIWDNDGVSGSKSSRTHIMTFKIPSFKEINELENAADENIKEKLDKSMKLADEIQKDLQKLRERNLDGNTTDWENKQMLENILEKQDLLKQLTEEIARENEEKNKMHHKFNEQDEEILKKQEEIQKLLDEIMTDELKELMKQLQELQEKFNEKMMNQILEENEFSYEEMKERLDRTKELLKREQIEQKINKTIDELNKLSEEQKELSEQTKSKELNKEELKNKQKDIEKKFDEIQEEYDKAQELNKELKSPMKLDDFEKQKQEIQEEFEKTNSNLEKGKKSKASDSQNSNSQKMKKMADSMQSMMQANSSQQQGEDIESLRKILENLLTFSFKQEDLKNKFKNTRNSDPKYIELSGIQLSMKDDFTIINDSLKSLAERVAPISKPILDELYNINTNLREVPKYLEKRKIANAKILQNEIMTSSNNLALLLSEIINQMKKQQSGSGSGGGKSKPKKGKQQAKDQGMQDLKGMQEGLKKQMEQMLKQMKEGKGKPGGKSQNKQLAKMLAQQEIFRQMMKDLNAQFSLSPETQKLLREIDKLAEENQKDIVNKRITPELFERQKKIETRLLEAENAENKRKTEDKRKSTEGKDKIYKSAEDVFKKSKKNNSFNEDLYRKNIQLNNFYKKLYDEYSKSISN